jgi:hypothetical protein
VTVTGQPAGSTFAATEIDTPYHLVASYPYDPYFYGYYPYWSGAPAYGGFGWGWHRWR